MMVNDRKINEAKEVFSQKWESSPSFFISRRPAAAIELTCLITRRSIIMRARKQNHEKALLARYRYRYLFKHPLARHPLHTPYRYTHPANKPSLHTPVTQPTKEVVDLDQISIDRPRIVEQIHISWCCDDDCSVVFACFVRVIFARWLLDWWASEFWVCDRFWPHTRLEILRVSLSISIWHGYICAPCTRTYRYCTCTLPTGTPTINEFHNVTKRDLTNLIKSHHQKHFHG